MSLQRRIVITGATRGLGRALADGFAACGCMVAGCGRSADKIESLRQELGPPHDFAVIDVTDGRKVAKWAAMIIAAGGPPDLLLNNAALINETAPLWEIGEEEFSRVIDVNIKGVANVIRAFIPVMIRRGSGIIVNFSSGWGRSTSPGVAPYCATKWAIEGMTAALARELPSGVAAVALNPGIIDTEMLRMCFGDDAADYPGPAEWAKKAIPFLLMLNAGDNGRAMTIG